MHRPEKPGACAGLFCFWFSVLFAETVSGQRRGLLFKIEQGALAMKPAAISGQ